MNIYISQYAKRTLAALALTATAILIPATASALVVVDNTASSGSGAATNYVAQAFQTGSDDLLLSLVSLKYSSLAGGTGLNHQVHIYSDNTGTPGATPVYSSDVFIGDAAANQLIEFNFAGELLSGNTIYWVVLQRLGDNRFFWANNTTATSTSDVGGILPPASYSTQVSSTGTTWLSSSSPLRLMKVEADLAAEPIPEPSSIALMGLATLGLSFYLLRKRSK